MAIGWASSHRYHDARRLRHHHSPAGVYLAPGETGRGWDGAFMKPCSTP